MSLTAQQRDRLPKAVRHYLDKLEADLQELRAQIDFMTPKEGKLKTPWALVDHGENGEILRPLPHGSLVRYTFPKVPGKLVRHDRYVEFYARKTHAVGPRALEASSQGFNSGIIVRPQFANVIRLEVD